MKVLRIGGLGVSIALCSSQALAQTPAAEAPAEGPSAPAETPAAPAPPPAAPKTESPRAHVLWKEPSPDDPRPSDDTETEDSDEPAEPAAKPETPQPGTPPTRNSATWSLSSASFAVSVERVTSMLGWSKKLTIAPMNGVGEQVEAETTGVDVSFLGAGALRSASGVPRVAFDVLVDGGFTIGGGISYMASSGKVTNGANLPDGSLFLFAPRLGVLLEASSSVGIWLRGGFTHTAVTNATQVATSTGAATETDTLKAWDLSLDPALVIVAAPHVAFTITGLLEIGVSGTLSAQVDGQSAGVEADYSNSNYGLTGGLVALF